MFVRISILGMAYAAGTMTAGCGSVLSGARAVKVPDALPTVDGGTANHAACARARATARARVPRAEPVATCAAMMLSAPLAALFLLLRCSVGLSALAGLSAPQK